MSASVRALLVLALALAALGGCKKKNPSFCESDEDCRQPLPVCDVDGTIGGTANTCVGDADEIDAGLPAIDAAPPAPSQTATKVLAPAAGRVSGATYSVDVQLGAPTAVDKTSGDSHTVQPASPVQE